MAAASTIPTANSSMTGSLGSSSAPTADAANGRTTAASPGPAEGYTEFAQRATKSAKVGPSRIETLDGSILPVTYTWDYASKRVDLRALYEKSKDLVWNPRTEIDWSIDVDPYRENSPDQGNPMYGTAMWNKLDPNREIPELRR